MHDPGDGDPQRRGGVADEVRVEVEQLLVMRPQVQGRGGDAVDGFVLVGYERGASVDERGVPFFLGGVDVVAFLGDGEVHGVVLGVSRWDGFEYRPIEGVDAVGSSIRVYCRKGGR